VSVWPIFRGGSSQESHGMRWQGFSSRQGIVVHKWRVVRYIIVMNKLLSLPMFALRPTKFIAQPLKNLHV
jgi:hypothetical protein